MTSCGRLSVRKHREIKNIKQCIILDISSKIDFLEKRLITSSESRDYMKRPGKGLTTSMNIRTKSPNKKQNAGFYITAITKQDFRKFINKFENSPYLVYKSKQVNNEPTDAYLFLIKQITKIIKS